MKHYIRAWLCRLFGHRPDKYMRPAVGGRNVRRCLRCEVIVEEQKVAQRDVERYAPVHRPTGRISDTWRK
jgi:hypothetical protein